MIAQVFTAEEWRDLLAQPDFQFHDCPVGLEQLTPEMLIVAVLDPDNAEVFAAWPLWNATHLDGLWVQEKARGNPGVLRPLLDTVSATLTANQVHTTFALLADHDVEGQAMAERLGFARVPGVVYRRETPP